MTTAATAHRNDVRLVGEVEARPAERTLASGDGIVTFRLRVCPDPDSGAADSIECTVRAGRLRRSVLAWHPGDLVAVDGAVRRRFYRTGPDSRPFVVVEVTGARRVARAG